MNREARDGGQEVSIVVDKVAKKVRQTVVSR